LDGSPLKIDDANNRVGIGTASPSYTLDVDGDINMRTGHSFYYDAAGATNPNPIFWIDGENADIDIIRVGTDQFVTDSDYGMTLKYRGSGSGNDNTFDIEMDAQAGAQVVAMRIYQNGNVVQPNQPMFMAHRPVNTPTSSLSGGESVLPFNATSQNVGGHYNTSNYRFTAPVSGFYWFSCNTRIDGMGATGYYRLCIRKNSTTPWNEPNPHVIVGGTGVATNYESFTTSGLQYLSAGDYVEAVFTNQGSVSSGFQHESTFSGFLVG
jgi:hypothetical protein